MQGVKHLKVWLLHMDQVVDGAELTGYNRLQKMFQEGNDQAIL